MRRFALGVGGAFVVAFVVLAPGGAFADPGQSADGFAVYFGHHGMPRTYSHGYYSPLRSSCGLCDSYGCGGGCGCRECGCHCDDRCGSYGYGYGTSWSTMRRYLADSYHVGHRHYRSWWIRRWPVRWAGAPGYGAYLCRGPEGAEDTCPFAKAAASAEGAPVAGEDRLLRGLERWRLGKTDAADEDFRAALEADPKNARAQYGRLLCAVVRRDWDASADALRRLTALGELDARDRLDEQDAADSPLDVPSFLPALRGHVKWNFDDPSSQLVCGWMLATSGNADVARAHLKAALRWAPGDAAATKLLADLDGAAAAGPAPAPPATPAPAPGALTAPEAAR